MRALVLCALALAAALGAGCGSDRRGASQGGFVEGDSVTVFVAVPRSEPGGEDLLAGAKLALADSGGRIADYAISLGVLDESPPGGGLGVDLDRVQDNLRRLLRDPAAVALIGEVDSRAAIRTAPLLNAAGLPQVSPGAGYAGLTTDRRARRGEPERYVPAGDAERTYARLVAADVDLAPAMIDAAGDARRVAVEAEGSEAGRALDEELRSRLGARLVDDPARAQAVIYAGDDPVNAAGVLESVAREAPRALLIGGDALARAAVAEALPASVRRRLRLVSNAPQVDPDLAARFRSAFGRAPGPYVAVGYEAMDLVVDSMKALGDNAGVRDALARQIRSARRTGTPLGDYTFDEHGDTTRRATTLVP